MTTHQRIADLTLQRISTLHDGFHDAVIIKPDSFLEQGIVAIYDWDKLPAARQLFQVLLYAKMGLSSTMKQLMEDARSVLTEIKAVLN